MKSTHDALVAAALSCGASAAAIIDTESIETDPIFRKMCEANDCGMYGKCYMCPPDVGKVEDLIAELYGYAHVLVYQCVFPLEDSFDVEGMDEARRAMHRLSRKLRAHLDARGIKALHLNAGGCGVCKTCAKRTELPCPTPTLATPSLEAYCINVASLAASAGMRYNNGERTVTYFGAVLFTKDEKEDSSC